MWIDDQVLDRCDESLAIELWVPSKSIVVLGRSNRADREVNLEACLSDGVEVFKRLGGGGTVLLHDGCLVASVGVWVKEFYANDRYFRLLNQSVIDCFRSVTGLQDFSQRGHSDIVFGDRKLVGTSLFRSRNYLLFQASILIHPRLTEIERYLPHPSAEPDYRQGRQHRSFLMGLAELHSFSVAEWLTYFNRHWSERVIEQLLDEKIASVPTQVDHVKSRRGEQHSLNS